MRHRLDQKDGRIRELEMQSKCLEKIRTEIASAIGGESWSGMGSLLPSDDPGRMESYRHQEEPLLVQKSSQSLDHSYQHLDQRNNDSGQD